VKSHLPKRDLPFPKRGVDYLERDFHYPERVSSPSETLSSSPKSEVRNAFIGYYPPDFPGTLPGVSVRPPRGSWHPTEAQVPAFCAGNLGGPTGKDQRLRGLLAAGPIYYSFTLIFVYYVFYYAFPLYTIDYVTMFYTTFFSTPRTGLQVMPDWVPFGFCFVS